MPCRRLVHRQPPRQWRAQQKGTAACRRSCGACDERQCVHAHAHAHAHAHTERERERERARARTHTHSQQTPHTQCMRTRQHNVCVLLACTGSTCTTAQVTPPHLTYHVHARFRDVISRGNNTSPPPPFSTLPQSPPHTNRPMILIQVVHSHRVQYSEPVVARARARDSGAYRACLCVVCVKCMTYR